MDVSPTSLSNRYHIRFDISWVSYRFIIIALSSVATVPPFHEEFIHIGIRSASHEFPCLLGISFISHRCLIGGFNIDTSSASVSEDYRYLIGMDDVNISSACHTTLSAVFESTEPSTIPANQPRLDSTHHMNPSVRSPENMWPPLDRGTLSTYRRDSPAYG